MNEPSGYVVFFFPPALEVLGAAIKPYLLDGPVGLHIPCREVDTAGAFVEMTLVGKTADGAEVEVELMVPGNMVRMIVSARSTHGFGFGFDGAVRPLLEPGIQEPGTQGPNTQAPSTPASSPVPGVGSAPPEP
jgi:hypothetical protein